MNAIIALAARHMSHISKNAPPRIRHDYESCSIRHYNECSEALRPMLLYDETFHDENMFAAAIIQRVWEETEGTP